MRGQTEKDQHRAGRQTKHEAEAEARCRAAPDTGQQRHQAHEQQEAADEPDQQHRPGALRHRTGRAARMPPRPLRIAEQGEQGDHRNYDRDQAAIFPATAP